MNSYLNTISKIRTIYRNISDSRYAVLVVAIAAIGLPLDFAFPSIHTVGILYVPLLFLYLLIDNSPQIRTLLSLIIVCIVAGIFVPEPDNNIARSLVNHASVIIVAVIVANLIKMIGDYKSKLRDVIEGQHKLIQENQKMRVLSEASAKAKNDFMHVISHELHTPLNPIIGFSEMRQNNDLCSNSECKKYASYINSAAKDMLKTVDRIIDFVSMPVDKSDCRHDNVNLIDVVVRVVRDMESETSCNRIVAQEPLSRDNFQIIGNADMLTRALRYVVNNSIKFSAPGSIVDIKLEETDSNSVAIIVIDRGPGIPLKILNNIGEPFLQGDQSLSRRFDGLGMGLALSKKIIEHHNGSLIVHETSPNGTTIYLEFPKRSVCAHL